MTRLRDQYDRNLASMAARYEAAERELDGLGPVSAPAPPLPAMTAEEWDKDTPAAEQAAYHPAARPAHHDQAAAPAAQGASRLPGWW